MRPVIVAATAALVSLTSAVATADSATPFERVQELFDQGQRLSFDTHMLDGGVYVGRCARNDGRPIWEGVLMAVNAYDDPLIGRVVSMTAHYTYDDQYYSSMGEEQLLGYLGWSEDDFDLDQLHGDAAFVYDGRFFDRATIFVRSAETQQGQKLLVTSEWQLRNCYLWRRL